MITGAKKQKGQAQRPHIAPDDLVSADYAKILYGLAEGEIYGLADGGKSIRLDGTPLINDNGQPNFEGVSWQFRTGTLDQSHIDGFVAVENETNVGVELRHDRPFVRAITNRDLSAVRVRLNFNALRQQHDNGDITGYAIEYAIDVQTEGGAFVQVLQTSVRGKAASGFKRSHRIDLPSAGTAKRWTIRVRRITPNANSDLISDNMSVDAITEIIDAKLRYPCTAVLGLSYNAKTFNNIAKLAVRLKGKLIQVPTNYNPDTRTYTGLWDGQFKLAYSNNPAWVYYDLCTHKRYGLGERLAGMVDKWRLYQIGQYCDELVDDGKGGQEPRFTVNVYIQKADDAYRVLQNLASVFRGMSFWDGQQIVIDGDAPKDPVYTFSRANVVGGEFSYTGTRARDRHTVVFVAWDDPDNDFKTDYEPVSDEQAIAKYGIRRLDINAFGCTSRGQAQRAGLWALKSEQLETRTVSFKTGLQGFIPQVGQIINIADDLFAGRAISGRIVSANARTISLDRVAGKVGDTISINAGGQVHTAKITAVRGSTLTLDKAVGSADDVWAIISDDLTLMQFRVLSISQNDDMSFDITALEYNAQKYDVVDNGATIVPPPYTVLKATPIQAPQSVTLTATTRTHQGQAVTTLSINWAQVTGATAYIVEWRKDDGNWQSHKVTGQSLDIDGVYGGQYIARVRAIDSFDNESLATSSQITPITGKQGRPPRLARLTAQGKLFAMDLAWVFNKGSDDTNYTEIQVSPDGRSNIATLGTFAYPTNKHEITGLQGNLTQYYRARIVDKLGNTSDWTAWVSGTTSAQADKVLDLLQGQITQSQLHRDLSTPIAKILPLETGLNGVKGQMPTLQSAISAINGQLPTLNTKIATAERNLQTAQNTLNTAVANITTERNRISSAIRDISALQSANNAKTQEITNLTQTVNGHTSSIRELGLSTGDLAQKYNQLKTQADKSTSDITQIKQTQAGQATSIERLGVSFDNLSVGGRNLLRETANIASYRNFFSWGDVTKDGGFVRLVSDVAKNNGVFNGVKSTHTIKSGADYVVSFAYRTNAPNLAYTFVLADSGNLALGQPTNFANDETWQKAVIARTAPRDLTNIRLLVGCVNMPVGAYIEVKDFKIEKGTIATDYTEAPEDTQSQLDTKASSANLETLRQTLSNADTALSQQITALDTAYKSADRTLSANLASEISTRTSADSALGQRIDSLAADYNGNKSSVASQIRTLTDAKNSQATQISQITANVTTAQSTANTATTKADNAQRTANTANSAITAEQRARADADSSLSSRINALDSKFTNADNTIKASVAQAQQTASNAQQAVATAQSQLNAKIDGLNVGGRNLILNSHATRSTHGSTALNVSQNIDLATVRQLVLSCDVKYANARRATAQGAKWFRIGTEIRLVWTDGTSNWYGAWRANVANGNSFHGKVVHKITIPAGKTIRSIDNVKIQIWDITGDGILVKNAKLEIGTIATDWTPAPEDTQSQLDTKASTASLDEFKSAQATQDTATASRITALDTAYKQADSATTARLAREEGARASADTALTQRMDSLQSTVNGNKASVDSQLKALSDKDKAQAQKLSQLESNLNTKANASALNQTNTKVGQIEGRINAEAQKTTTLQTTVGSHTASIQQQAQAINGLNAQWTVKVESGGIVAGIGLASENGNSIFAIRANKFYVADPTGTAKRPMFSVLTAPQTINGVQVPKGVYISSAYIQNGSITTAKIGTAQIDTLQIKDGAVVVPRAKSFQVARNYASNTTHNVLDLSLPNARGASALINGFLECHATLDGVPENENITLQCFLTKDGKVIWSDSDAQRRQVPVYGPDKQVWVSYMNWRVKDGREEHRLETVRGDIVGYKNSAKLRTEINGHVELNDADNCHYSLAVLARSTSGRNFNITVEKASLSVFAVKR